MSNHDDECVRCRKRSPEPASKVCESCGLPLHASCSEDAARRDCGLQFGFPGSTTYCSKRCFEAEGFSPRNSDAGEASSARPERGGQVPNEVTAALTVKIGDVSRTSRKQLTLTTFPFLLA
ncbi:hypothetical protein BBJ28_00026077, partial [Nothophytophthora sp. Chile5]